MNVFHQMEGKGGIYSHSVAGALKEIYKGESKVDIYQAKL